jgi:DNA-binding transcriptional LysR family regulator
MRIDHVHLARLDLNLLVALDALLTERSVTRAAGRIGISQSAMSHALARLRTTFSDELLTRGPDGMRPTPRALALIAPVQAALSQIQEITAPPDAFDPATADITFTLGIPDSTEVLLMPTLIAHLQAVAPGVKLLLHTVDRHRILDDLDSGRVDLGIGVFEQGQTHHKRRILNKESYLCIFNADLVGVTAPISLDDYVRLPHLLTSLVGERPRRRRRCAGQDRPQARHRPDLAALLGDAVRRAAGPRHRHDARAAGALLRRQHGPDRESGADHPAGRLDLDDLARIQRRRAEPALVAGDDREAAPAGADSARSRGIVIVEAIGGRRCRLSSVTRVPGQDRRQRRGSKSTTKDGRCSCRADGCATVQMLPPALPFGPSSARNQSKMPHE